MANDVGDVKMACATASSFSAEYLAAKFVMMMKWLRVDCVDFLDLAENFVAFHWRWRSISSLQLILEKGIKDDFKFCASSHIWRRFMRVSLSVIRYSSVWIIAMRCGTIACFRVSKRRPTVFIRC